MTGVPCGNGCTMGDGLCINGRCFDRTGQIEWECMAPMRAPGSFAPFRLNGHDAQPSWMQQQPPAQPRQQQQAQDPYANFNAWQQQMPRFAPIWQPWGFSTFWRPMSWFAPPFAPMGPMFNNDCGGKGPCAKGQFCDTQGVCRADDCVSQFKYGCPDDKGELKKVSSWGCCWRAAGVRVEMLLAATAEHSSSSCLAEHSSSDCAPHATCLTCPNQAGVIPFLPLHAQIACPHFSGFKECYTSTSDGFRCFKGPSGSSLACASQSNNAGGSVWSSSSGSSFQWPAWEDDNLPDADADAPAAGVKAPVAAPQPPPATKAAPVAKPAEPKPAAAGAKAEATIPTAASSNSISQQSAFKKVATEAGPAQAASAVAAGAATPVQKKQLVASGNRNLLAGKPVLPASSYLPAAALHWVMCSVRQNPQCEAALPHACTHAIQHTHTSPLTPCLLPATCCCPLQKRSRPSWPRQHAPNGPHGAPDKP